MHFIESGEEHSEVQKSTKICMTDTISIKANKFVSRNTLMIMGDVLLASSSQRSKTYVSAEGGQILLKVQPKMHLKAHQGLYIHQLPFISKTEEMQQLLSRFWFCFITLSRNMSLTFESGSIKKLSWIQISHPHHFNVQEAGKNGYTNRRFKHKSNKGEFQKLFIWISISDFSNYQNYLLPRKYSASQSLPLYSLPLSQEGEKILVFQKEKIKGSILALDFSILEMTKMLKKYHTGMLARDVRWTHSDKI